jgi:5-methylcytosine-specific restriction endonuclease McrA
LAELSVEAAPESPPDCFTTRQLARKVLTLYWPQVRPIGSRDAREAATLRQNTGRPARILVAISAAQQRIQDVAEGRSPSAWGSSGAAREHERLIDDVERSLIMMPLARLQRLPGGTVEFIYHVNWSVADVDEPARRRRLEAAVRAYQREQASDFDNRILMLPGVVDLLARFHGLIRQLVEARWVEMVRHLNPGVFDDPDLHGRLFGPNRENLRRMREPLLELQQGRCFYCGRAARAVDVDHFLPWARYPDDGAENLVVACAPCNNDKRAHLPAVEHLDHWLPRFDPSAPAAAALADVAARKAWVHGGARTLAVARHLYERHPVDTPLWLAAKGVFQPWELAQVLDRIDRTFDRLAAPT